ncbi:hypothetical protein [Agrobacterium tumefaciens]|uniref:Uncharacterized protein n=1 Tax=Agrobacterium tumefaciens TaxID=358 RepID=A0AA44JEF5_AGRTU|nr:hypothetical protein [Agrobacterium tumefaciens]NSL20193.1 hypothetical protein [Agrobacterium tumefaciens]NTB88353.1 hypothetical protein [Agrobacterium tumefaciens]NTC18397.1 hypothetical protein [Agrobacterium tumefaciens]NTC32157.1 hypothetical protein [Agrobacterium tumefaciens]NTC54662.1 hypothetical protein [Agrobacterium tumefaciens]
MTEENDGKPEVLTQDMVWAVAGQVNELLEHYAQAVPEAKKVSSDTEKAIAKRLSVNGAKKFTTVRSLPFFFASELLTYLQRIQIYPFVAKYREVVKPSSADMNAAWQLHSHSLRQSECYVIQERGTDMLEFAHSVATDLGLGTKSRAKIFENRFKKHFATRLRDRHRVVHAHEKPSLTTRVTDLMVAADKKNPDEMNKQLMTMMFNVSQLLPGLPTDDPAEAIKRMFAMREEYPKIAEREAVEMMDIFYDELVQTISPPNK